MDEYFCPNCGAILNDQYGFDPYGGSWTCTACGMHLMDEDVYDGDTFEGVAWYCDDCGALLNRQSGFSDSYGSWQCTQCGHLNGTTEDDIINTGPKCPNCDSYLKSQSYYGGYEDDWTCEECGAKLHRDYSCDPYEVVQEDYGQVCPSCNASLEDQHAFSDWMHDYTCYECGAKLHRNYNGDPFEVAVEDDDGEEPECPRCGDVLGNQYGYSDVEDDWVCENCRAKLHRDCSWEPYEEVNAETEKERASHTPPRASKQPKASVAPKGDLRKARIKAFLFKRKRVKFGYDPQDLLKANYKDVITLLHNNAFNNIKSLPIKDIYTDSPYAIGEVAQVVVNGSQHFTCDDMVPYDAEIIITYHEKKEIALPFNSRFCRKKNRTEIANQFRDLGFTNIYEYAIRDLTTGWLVKDGSIEKITIGKDESFKKKSVYTYDTKIAIEYHTFKKKK
jgi:DNA-directed RNA polymerase subunit RPC12/RpoP